MGRSRKNSRRSDASATPPAEPDTPGSPVDEAAAEGAANATLVDGSAAEPIPDAEISPEAAPAETPAAAPEAAVAEAEAAGAAARESEEKAAAEKAAREAEEKAAAEKAAREAEEKVAAEKASDKAKAENGERAGAEAPKKRSTSGSTAGSPAASPAQASAAKPAPAAHGTDGTASTVEPMEVKGEHEYRKVDEQPQQKKSGGCPCVVQ